MDAIRIRGARVHNLKNIDVDIPRNKFVVITGISGSGKSSLAFDTLYAEGQRRYVESLSAYARQFLGIMEKPDVEKIEGLSPAISIEQRKVSKNPRSTVATVTEIYDYLRVLFARIGKVYCYRCGREVTSQTLDQIVDRVEKYGEGTRIEILSPVIRGKKGEYRDLFEKLMKKGFLRVRVDGEIYSLEEVPALEKNKKHTIEIVVDRIRIKEGIRSRLSQSIETALSESDGYVIIKKGEEEELFSEKLACLLCGIDYPEIEPRLFSFNSPYGACRVCSGLGTKMEIDPELLIINPALSIMEGAIGPVGEPRGRIYDTLRYLSRKYRIDLQTPWENLKEREKEIILYGDDLVEGIIPYLERRYRETESDWVRYEIEKYMSIQPCPACKGARLRKEALSVKIGGKNIYDVVRMTVKEALKFFEELKLGEREKMIARELIREIKRRLQFLVDVGLDYLTLDRPTETLAGGEAQRVHLSTQIGSGLTGIIYILDEPSIGLHPRDIKRLIATLKELRDLGNTIVVVEHDKETILSADWVCLLYSGSGKSTLLIDILYRALARKFHGSRHLPGEHDEIKGIEHIDKVINIDQSPIGRTPRSNPATYTGAFTPIREFYASLPEAKIRGYRPGRFSFNVRGGRCEACQGDGMVKIEMHFLPDVYIPCEVCKGRRYNKETLEVKYKGKNIADVLEMTVDEALEFFDAIPQIKRKLQLLHDVGLGYIKLGQPAPTLSGGEAQRVKLARELSKVGTGRTLYILDEPTTGLHFEDVRLLLEVLQRLVDRGNTVVVIEHNLDVIKCCDWIIDLGPEGGEEGGRIVCEGPPEEVASCPHSYTGKFLKEELK